MARLLSDKVLDEVRDRTLWARACRETYEQEWEEALRYYIGDQWTDQTISVRDPLVVNKFWPLIQAAVPKLFFKAPYVFVKPSQKYAWRTDWSGQRVMVDLEANARSAEALVNRIWRNGSMHWMMREVIVDAYIYSAGWIKVGYSSEHGLTKEDEMKSIMPPDMMELNRLFPSMTEEDFFRISGQGKLLDFDSKIAPGHPWAKRINPMDVWVDPDADDLDNARFLIHRVKRQLRTVKADPIYQGTRDLQPEHDDWDRGESDFTSVRWPEGIRSNMSVSPALTPITHGDPVETINLFEYWDRERREVYTLVRQRGDDGAGMWKCIRRLTDWPFRDIRSFPYSCLRMNVIPNRFYPLTGLAQWVEQQRELNLYRSIMADHVRRHGRKIFVKSGFFTNKEEKSKAESPGAGIVVECTDPEAWKPMEFGAVSPDLYRMEAAIRNDIGESTLWGTSPNAMGQPNPHTTSATEASIMQGSQASLTDDQLSLVTEFASDFSRNLFLIYRQFWTGEQVIEYTNRVQGKEWVSVNSMTLRGEYDFIIEVGSTQKQSHEAQQQRAVQLLQLFMNPMILQMYGPEVLKNMIVRVLRKFEIDFPDEIFRDAMEWVPPEVRAKIEQEEAARFSEQTNFNFGGGNGGGPAAGQFQPNQSGGGMVEGTPPGGVPGNARGTIADALLSGMRGGQ